MIIQGIKTHNLKNISFCTEKPEIIGIYGVSGGGKSSLAFHTVYALCAHSFSAIESGFVEDSAYIIDDYSNLIPALAINSLISTQTHTQQYIHI